MTKKIVAGLKEFKEAKEMVRRTDKAIFSLEKRQTKEETNSSLTLQEKRMFSKMGADNEVAMMLFQDFLFAGIGITLFDDNMLDMLGITAANAPAVAMASEVAQDVVVESYEDKRKAYLEEQKKEFLEKQREYEAERERNNHAKRKNNLFQMWMLMLMVMMMASFQQMMTEITVDTSNDNDKSECENNNVVALFNDNKSTVHKSEPTFKANTANGFKLALGM